MSQQAQRDGSIVRVARSLEEVEALRPAWTQLQGSHFTSDIDVFLTVVRSDPGVLRPHVLVREHDGEPAAIVVARIEERALPARLGYLAVTPRVRMLTVAYGGFLGEDPSAPALVLGEARRSLAPEGIELLRLRMLTVGSPLHSAARAEANPWLRRRFDRPRPHWRCAVPDSLDEFLASRSKERRRNVRRYRRRLEEAFPGEVEVRAFEGREELDTLFAHSERIQRRTYQRAVGVGFSDTPLTRALTGLAMDRDWFLGAVLYLGGEPAAFWHGSAYRGVFSTTATGYDPALAEHRPGTYLLIELVDRLCADPTVHTLDFGFGDADYKRSFGDTSVLEEDVAVFEPRPRPLAVHAVDSAVLGTTTLGRAALARSGRLRAVRRAWRRRLDPSRE